MIEKYGREWPDEANDLTIELGAFMLGIPVEKGGLGKAGHARNVIDALWNYEGSKMRFDWHPWAERMLEHSCKQKYLSVAGCASSGKSDFYAVWAIINFMADPANTIVMVTSTSLKDSKLRIWGRVCEYWDAIPGVPPGKKVASMGIIKYVTEEGETLDNAGIHLLAGEKKKESDSIGKIIGFKRRRVILIADELPELSHAILTAALGNLESNPYFQFIGIGNPNSRFDPHGVFSKPRGGWKSISPMDGEWETDYGYCIRFDGEQSPNILAGETLYPYLLTQAKLDKGKQRLGENSISFWRMFRGYWSPTGSEAAVYSEAEITLYEADEREVFWKEKPARVGFLDTAFTAGGDRAMVKLGNCGLDTANKVVLLYDEDEILLSEDVTDTETPLNHQIARQYRDLCIREKVAIEDAGLDSTGGGGPFSDILTVEWGTGFYRCYFGGSASDRPASTADPRPGKDAYVNRVSEIWYAGVELVRNKQLKGMSAGFIREATARLYKSVKRGGGEAMQVEPKPEMKARTGMSPDIADAGFGLIDLCRDRHNLISVEGEVIETTDITDKHWDRFVAEGDGLNHSRELTSGKEDDYFSESNSGFFPM